MKINVLIDAIPTYREAVVSPATHAFRDQLNGPENQQVEQGKFRPSSSGFVHCQLPSIMARVLGASRILYLVSTESEGSCALCSGMLSVGLHFWSCHMFYTASNYLDFCSFSLRIFINGLVDNQMRLLHFARLIYFWTGFRFSPPCGSSGYLFW